MYLMNYNVDIKVISYYLMLSDLFNQYFLTCTQTTPIERQAEKDE